MSENVHPIVRAELAEAEAELERLRSRVERLSPLKFVGMLVLFSAAAWFVGIPNVFVAQIFLLAAIGFLATREWSKRSARQQQLLVSQLRAEAQSDPLRSTDAS